MGMLTLFQQKEMAMAHRHLFCAVCDEPECGKLIPVGSLYVVLQWTTEKFVSGGVSSFRQVAAKVRCMDCQKLRQQKVVSSVKTKEKTVKQAINSQVRRAVLDILRGESLDTDILFGRVRKRKAFAKLKKGEFLQTVRAMKKLHIIKRSKRLWVTVK